MFVYKTTIEDPALYSFVNNSPHQFKSQYQYFVRNTSISIKNNYPNIYIRLKKFSLLYKSPTDPDCIGRHLNI